MQNKKGFTLAEVMIVIGIIGIVANMTIPTLLNSVNKQQYVIGLKKAYTVFNQVLIQIAADNGCVGDLKCTGLFATGTDSQTLGEELVKYFKVAKNCESSDGGLSIAGCFPDNMARYYNGSYRGTGSEAFSAYRFITSDGMSFFISNQANNCDDSQSLNVTYNMTQICGNVYIDVNGFKGPNNLGRDIFWLYITNGKGPLLYPVGGADDWAGEPWDYDTPHHCSPDDANGAYSGQDCTGRVIEEGWQMNY